MKNYPSYTCLWEWGVLFLEIWSITLSNVQITRCRRLFLRRESEVKNCCQRTSKTSRDITSNSQLTPMESLNMSPIWVVNKLWCLPWWHLLGCPMNISIKFARETIMVWYLTLLSFWVKTGRSVFTMNYSASSDTTWKKWSLQTR